MSPDPHISVRRRLLSGGLWALAGRAAGILLGLVCAGLLARLLSPADMGDYFLVVSFMQIGGVLGTLGLTNAIVRLVPQFLSAERAGSARAAVHKALWLCLAGSGCVALPFVAGIGKRVLPSLFHSPSLAAASVLIGLLVMAEAFQRITAEGHRGLHRIGLAVGFNGLFAKVGASVCYLALFVFRGTSQLALVLVCYLGAVTASAGLGVVSLCRRVRGLTGGAPVSAAELLRVSMPMWLTGLVLFFANAWDIWIIGALLSHEDLALYAGAKKVVELVVIPLTIVNVFLPPLIAELYTKGETRELEKALRATATLAGIPAAVALVVLGLFGRPLLGMVYGEFYRDAAGILAILCGGQMVNVFVGSCGFTLMMTGHEKLMLKTSLFSGGVTVVGCLMAAVLGGVRHVALMFSVGVILHNILLLVFVRRKCGVWTHAYVHIAPVLRSGFVRGLWRGRAGEGRDPGHGDESGGG